MVFSILFTSYSKGSRFDPLLGGKIFWLRLCGFSYLFHLKCVMITKFWNLLNTSVINPPFNAM
jgi:hypothetical protein